MSVTNIIPCHSTKDDVGTATNRGFVIRMGKNTEWASYPGACRSIARGSTLRPTTGDGSSHYIHCTDSTLAVNTVWCHAWPATTPT